MDDCPEDCPLDFFVANAFTPNGDNLNDRVCLRSEHFDKYARVEFMIYSRWGEEIFRRSWDVNANEGQAPDRDFFCWDGTYNGKELPPDVYGYYLSIICPESEEPEEFSGNITLLQR